MKTEYCKCGTLIEDPDNMTRECLTCKSMSALPAPFPCDICGEQIETLRLIKWRESGQVIRCWVCLNCWRKVYHAEGGDGEMAQGQSVSIRA